MQHPRSHYKGSLWTGHEENLHEPPGASRGVQQCVYMQSWRCSYLLTGALVPSGIAISDVFFKDHLGGDISRLTPSYLKSANGATDNATMTTLGEVSMQLKFSRINMIFKGQAVVLENLSLPIILGVNFLKHNSLSPFLTPQLAQLVHTPSLQTQDLIANVGENKFKPPPLSLQIQT